MGIIFIYIMGQEATGAPVRLVPGQGSRFQGSCNCGRLSISAFAVECGRTRPSGGFHAYAWRFPPGRVTVLTRPSDGFHPDAWQGWFRRKFIGATGASNGNVWLCRQKLEVI